MILGIVYDQNGDVKNHRSLLKVICNPLLRCFGLCIGTWCADDGHFGGLQIISCPISTPRASLGTMQYHLQPNDFVLNKRVLW